MPTTLNKLVEYTNDLLDLHKIPDFGPMGLQFQGSEEVSKIAATVSINRETIEAAAQKKVDVILAHHGLFWNNEPREDLRGRLDLLKRLDISVLGYHLCLDRHSKYGNNILAVRLLGLGSLTPWQDIGYSGKYKKPMDITSFVNKAMDKFTEYTPPIPEPVEFLPFGTNLVSKVAVITGGAPQYITQAYQDGFDTFVTGEIAEPTYYIAKDLGMNFLALGHYRTETLGVRALARHLAGIFRLKQTFLA